MADGETRKKYVILGVSTLILMAMVVAITIGTRSVTTDNFNRKQEMSESQKAVEALCAPTDYKETCIYSLKSVDSADPKELMISAFKVTANHLKQAVTNSTILLELEKDPRTKLALNNCHELAQHAVDDLERSFNKFDGFDMNNLDGMIDDLQVWLSASITYQETCLDGFEGALGDTGEKMRKVLNISMELTSNGLAMINDISSIATTLDLPSRISRRLLSDDVMGHGAEFPSWFDGRRRKLLQAKANSIKPDLIVAKDGSGKYRTINDALKDIPKNSNKTFVLYIKEGIYEEKVTFEKNQIHLMVIGDGPTKTRITGKLNYIDGTPTYHTATVVVLGDFFIAKDIGFENFAGAEKHQAVALRVGADKVIFYNCHMNGYQDTLYAHTYRQFYRNCQISGTIDFIFGDSATVFQNCTMVVRKPLHNQQCIVTAQGRKDVHQPTGLVLQNCSFVADPEYFPYRFELKSYLGRPWKEFSRTIIIESFIDDLIHPDGWLPWLGNFGLDTLFYSEFNNRGPSSNKNLRVQWKGVKELQVARVERFLAPKFIEGDAWIPATGVPYSPGFIFPPPKEDSKIKYSVVAPEETKDLGSPKEKESYKAFPSSKSTNSNKPNSSNIVGPQSPNIVLVLTPPTEATPSPDTIPILTLPIEATPPVGATVSPDTIPVLTPSAGATPPVRAALNPDTIPVFTPPIGAVPVLASSAGTTSPIGVTHNPDTIPVLTLSTGATSPIGATPKPVTVPAITPTTGATPVLTPLTGAAPPVRATPNPIIVPVLTPTTEAVHVLTPLTGATSPIEVTPNSDIITTLTQPVGATPSVGDTPNHVTIPTLPPLIGATPPTGVTPNHVIPMLPLPTGATPNSDTIHMLTPSPEVLPVLTSPVVVAHNPDTIPILTPLERDVPVLTPPTEATPNTVPVLTLLTGTAPIFSPPAKASPNTIPVLTLPAGAAPILTPQTKATPNTVPVLTPPTGAVPILSFPVRATPNPKSNNIGSISNNNFGPESPDVVPVTTPPTRAQSPRTSISLGPTSNNPPPKSTSSSILSWFSREH